MKAALLLFVLAGCAAPRVPPVALIAPCDAATMPPHAPAATASRTVLARWSVQLQLAREATAAALADCSDRQARLVEWVGR